MGRQAGGCLITIYRTTKAPDLAAIQELDKVFFFEAVQPHQATVWWIARTTASPRDVAGYAGARIMKSLPRTAFLERAAVCRWARGRGLQRRLIRARLRWAKARGCDRAITYTINNPPSSNNLIACGFKLYEPQKRWIDGDDVLFWERRL